jgi:hypothetical protein
LIPTLSSKTLSNETISHPKSVSDRRDSNINLLSLCRDFFVNKNGVMGRFTEADLTRLGFDKDGKRIKTIKASDTVFRADVSKSKNNGSMFKKQSKKAYSNKEKDLIEWILKDSGIPYVKEYRFCARRWKFDFAIPLYKWAFEYEGIYSAKSRHTTMSGYSKDTVKYNKAALLGWKVFRYTSMTYKNMAQDLEDLKLTL